MKIPAIAVLSIATLTATAQEIISVQQAVALALENNPGIKAAGYKVEAQRQMRKTSFDLPKTDVTLLFGQYNGYAKSDNNISVTQRIPFSSFGSQGKLNRAMIASAELEKSVSENELVYRVKHTYYELAYAYALHDLLLDQDSIFEGFYKSASLRYQAGETKLLEKTTAEVQRNEAGNRITQNGSDIAALRSQLRALLNTGTLPDIPHTALNDIPLTVGLDSAILTTNPSLAYSRQQIEVAGAEKNVEASKSAPDLLLGFFNQTLIGVTDPETGAIATGSDRFTGFQVGLSIPLWYAPHRGRTRAAEYRKRAAESEYIADQLKLASQLEQAVQAFGKSKASLNYYHTSALPNADLILKQSQAAFRAGEIGYAEYLLGLRQAVAIKEDYLRTLNNYNQSIILIEFITGNK